MDVFAIKKNGSPSLLNIDNFEELTKKDFRIINMELIRNVMQSVQSVAIQFISLTCMEQK